MPRRTRPIDLYDELSLWSAPFGLMLLDAVPYRSGQRILDIGCGGGFPLVELAERISGSRVVGVDPSREACARARKKCRDRGLSNVLVLQRSAESLTLPDRSVDLIVSNNGLNNVADLPAVLRQCRRALRPGGRLVATINLPGTMREFYRVFEAVLRDAKVGDGAKRIADHIRRKRMTTKEFVATLERHGFRVLRTKEERFTLRYSDGDALLRHTFIRLAFAPAWNALVPPGMRSPVFRELGRRLNETASMRGGIGLTIPALCVTAIPTGMAQSE